MNELSRKNKFIVTPFLLDQPVPDLESLIQKTHILNKPALLEATSQQRLSQIHQPLAQYITDVIADGERPVSIAGDCCTTIGVLAGLQRAGLDPVLLWLDAHGDFNTWETSPSGFIGGMPLAMLVGRGEQTMMNAAGTKPLPENQVILCDARDLDPLEKQALAESKVHHVNDARNLLQHPQIARPLYVHFDTDIVNPDDAPAMSYATAGGPTAAELQSIFRSLARSAQIVAVSMTTWNFALDKDGRSQAVCMELLRSLIEQ
jgi:arginase